VLVSQPANRAALLRAVVIADRRRAVARFSEHPADDVPWARTIVERLEKLHVGAGDRSDAPQILQAYANAAVSLTAAEPDEALRIGRQGSELALLFNLPVERGKLLATTAEILRERGDLDQALKTAQEAVALLDPGPGEPSFAQSMEFIFASIGEGLILGGERDISLGRRAEAVRVLERAFKIADVLVHHDPNDQSSRRRLGICGTLLAANLRHTDPRRALSVYDHALQHMAEIRSPVLQRIESWLFRDSSYALRSLGRPAEARQRLERALAVLKDLRLYPADKLTVDDDVDNTLQALADQEAETGDVARAIEIDQELLDGLAAGGIKPETKLAEAMDLSNIYGSIAALYRRSGRTDLASAFEKRRLDLWRHWARELPNNPFVRRQIAAAARP
jgi:tetratricopeptide (TPR) repeat protein